MSLDPAEAWREGLAPGPACLTPEQICGELSAALRAHVEVCARCQAERALWESFDSGKPRADEALPVQWIAAETRRRMTAQRDARSSWFAGLLARPWMMGTVAACLVAGAGLVATRNPAPGPLPVAGEEVYRGGSVELVEPAGDLAAAPSLLKWRAVAGAASYEVQISEVDREILWKSESAREQIAVPAPVRARLIAGKTVLWQVTAKDTKGNPVASSPSERFRVRPKSVPTGE